MAKKGRFNHGALATRMGLCAASGYVQGKITGTPKNAMSSSGTAKGISEAIRSGTRRMGTLQCAPTRRSRATRNRLPNPRVSRNNVHTSQLTQKRSRPTLKYTPALPTAPIRVIAPRRLRTSADRGGLIADPRPWRSAPVAESECSAPLPSDHPRPSPRRSRAWHSCPA